jgi:nicotinate-nucleotide adenylyltransferase
VGRRRVSPEALLAMPARTEAVPELERVASSSGRRIGILGGTFDPPHVGHLWLATLAADAIGLDRVLFMPASQPPHKRRQGMTRATDRLLMTRLAIAGDATFELTLIEMERPGPSYTIDSVDELARLYGDEADLYLLMAADSLAQVETWRRPQELLERIEWVIGPRPGVALPDRAELERRFGKAASRIHLLEGPSLDVSSSDIRARVAAGHAIRYLVPRGVEELITERGLYRRARRGGQT